VTADVSIASTFDAMWTALSGIGRSSATGGYRRFSWTAPDFEAREWFTAAARERALDVQCDRNGNLWAWWLPAGEHQEPRNAFVTGSHLDSVPDGGAFDGPLGVVSALCAVDVLRARGVAPSTPVAVVVFAEEEGARFGVACAGSRLLTGVLQADKARALTDRDGVSLATAMAAAGIDIAQLGRDDEALRRMGAFVELHIEQGRHLVDVGAPVGVATSIWPHGRWRFSFAGSADHAGTTQLSDRHDSLLCLAETVVAARAHAQRLGGLATFGRVTVAPNATNAIASHVDAWLDARAADAERLENVVTGITATARECAAVHGVQLHVVNESATPRVEFSADVRSRMHEVLGEVPDLATGAGHDAGVLAAEVPASMVFVRNPTGVSHSPAEFAERADCLAGIEALADVMAAWARK
jgi:beta-ureidopropionase / N-carbamoyl-L-amino-acid hydrolase